MTAADLAHQLNARRNGSGWMARCPGHEDDRASLSIAEGRDGRVLLKCHAGCTFEALLAALRLTGRDLMPERSDRKSTSNQKQIVATYDYCDGSGELLYQTVRYQPKDFRQRRPDGRGGWVWNLKGVELVLYRLPEVLAAVHAGKPIVVAEGEKDVLAIVSRGLEATCSPMGAGKWRDHYSNTLGSSHVFIVADADAAGRKHAQEIAASLHRKAASVRVIELPDIAGQRVKDASDYFAAGGTVVDFVALLEDAPEWAPQSVPPPKAEIADENGDGETAEVRGSIVQTLLDKSLSMAEKRSRIARVVVLALTRRGQFYYHAELRDYDSAMFFDRSRKRLERVRSDSFSAWLASWLQINRADALFTWVLAEAETAALSGRISKPIVPEVYWASRSAALYLSSGDGAVVKVTRFGPELADNGVDDVLFAAGRTLLPWTLTEPRNPFLACTLFSSLNCTAVHGPDLFRLFALSIPSNPRGKPPLCVSGDVGSGKTALARGLATLYGVPFVATKVVESAENDFWPAMDSGGLYCLDNVDTKCRWLPDALAAAATDGGTRRRKLYTDKEEVNLRSRSWLILTTANPSFASDAGLADRLLVVRMKRRTATASETALLDEIVQHRDAGLSFTVQMLSKALSDETEVPAGLNHRHPGFADFAVRIGRSMGRELESIAALQAAEADKSCFCVENDTAGSALVALLQSCGEFKGTAGELLERFRQVDSDFEHWSPKRLGKRLSALWPHLENSFGTARREPNRTGATVFTFRTEAPAGFAGFQTAFSVKPLA